MVGPAIREIRKKKGLTQRELADRSGVPQSSLSELENSEVIAGSYLRQLAGGLGVDIKEIKRLAGEMEAIKFGGEEGRRYVTRGEHIAEWQTAVSGADLSSHARVVLGVLPGWWEEPHRLVLVVREEALEAARVPEEREDELFKEALASEWVERVSGVEYALRLCFPIGYDPQ